MGLQIARIGLFLILIAITLFSIVILILNSLASQAIKPLIGFRTFPNVQDPQVDLWLNPLPASMFAGSQALAVVAAVVALVIGYVAAGLTIWIWPKNKAQVESHKIPWSILLGFNALLTGAALVYVFVANSMSSHFYVATQGPESLTVQDNQLMGAYGLNGSYSDGQFDLETWFCSLASAQLPGAAAEQPSFQRICSLESSSRWLFIPLVLLSFMAVLIGLWAMADVKDQQEEGEEIKIRLEQKDFMP